MKDIEMEATQDSTRSDPESLDAIFTGVMTCEPAITDGEIDLIEQWARSKDFGITRRAGLAVAAKSGAWFKELSEDVQMAGVMCEMLEPLDGQIRLLRELADTLDGARVRMTVALCNHDSFDPVTSTMRQAG